MAKVDLAQLTIQDSAPAKRGFPWKTTLILFLVLPFLATAGWFAWQEYRPRRAVGYFQVVTRSGTVEMRGSSFEAAGWVEPYPFPTLVPTLIEGFVTEVNVIEGDAVKKGDTLVKLYDADYALQVKQAEAEIATMRTELDYWKVENKSDQELYDAGALDILKLERDKTEVARLEAKIEQAGLNLELAKRNLARCVIRAPEDGVVLSRFVMPGMHLTPSGHVAGVLSLYKTDQIQIRVDVNLIDIEKAFPEQDCEIRVESAQGKVLKGRVIRFVHEANNQKNTVQVKVKVLEPDPGLKPEVLARVRFLSPSKTVDTGKESFIHFIPEKAVIRDGEHAYVFVARGEAKKAVAKKVHVMLGEARDGALVEIREGLDPSSKVVTTDIESLIDGEPIRALRGQ